MCTQRIGRSAPPSPEISSRSQSETRLPTVSMPTSLLVEPLPRLGQHRAQHVLDLLELLAVADQRRRELDHRIPAVVGAADQPAAEQLAGEGSAEQPLGLLVGEALLGLLIPDELDRVEEAVAANVADDRDVAQAVKHRSELTLLSQDVSVDVLALEHVEVRHRDGRRNGVAGEG